MRYLVGLLNSNVLNFYYDKVFNISSGLTTAIATENLELLPIKIGTDKQIKEVVETVKQIEKNPKDSGKINHLNRLIYDIYDLKNKDRGIIEKNI